MPSTDEPKLWQGDVVRGACAFLLHTLNYYVWPAKLGPDGPPVRRDAASPEDLRETHLIGVPAIQCDLMLVSQTCDIESKPTALGALVCPIGEALDPLGGEAPIDQTQVEAYKLIHAFPLPATEGYTASYADLRVVSTVRTKLLESCTVVRHVTVDEQRILPHFLKRWLGRLAAPRAIVEILKPIRNSMEKMKWECRQCVHSSHIKVSPGNTSVSVLVALDEGAEGFSGFENEVLDKLGKAQALASKAAAEQGLGFEFDIAYSSKVTLQRLGGMTRLDLEYLSYESPQTQETLGL